ncbi:MAG: hypothetical protein Q9170_006497, partial [Blastenia crenularia]
MCSSKFTGVPSQNVAVLSLTATSTVTISGPAAGSGSPGASNGQPLQPSPAPHPAAAVPKATTEATQRKPPLTSPPSLPKPSVHTESDHGMPPPATQSAAKDNENQSSHGHVSTQIQVPSPSSHVATVPGTGQQSVTTSQIPSSSVHVQNPDPTDLPVLAVMPQITRPPNPTNALAQPLPLPIMVAGKDVTRNAASQWMVGSETLIPGAQAITIGGTPVSLQPSATALIVGSSLMPLVTLSSYDVITVGGFTFSRGPDSNIVIGSQTIIPGSPAVMISGAPISLAVSGDVVVGSTPNPLPKVPNRNIFTIGDLVFTPGPGSGIVVGLQTLTRGAPAVMISGTPISLPTSGSAIIVGGSTIPIPTPTVPPLTATPPSTGLDAIITAAGFTLHRGSNSEILIGTQTLTPGASALTISSTPIFFGPSGSSLVIGSSTISLLFPINNEPTVLEISGFTFTETSSSVFIMGSQTLKQGSAITVNGTIVSLAPDATGVVVAGQTAVAVATSQGLGDVIMSAFFSGFPGAT